MTSRALAKRLERLVPRHLRELSPYVPGKPVEELERELGITGAVKLASNENPIGPSPRALKAIEEALADIHRYPDGGAFYLREKLAERLRVPASRVMVGNGSNELITLIARLVLKTGDHAVMADQSFAIYPLAVQGAGAESIRAPLRDFTHDLAAIAGAITERTRLVFLGNPNNPTGTIYRRADWERFLSSVPPDVVVICDDAYAEFVTDPEYPDTIREPDRHPLLVVLRTFSKAYGLAGLRVGYGVGPTELVDLIDRLRDPFNVNRIAQVAAIAALDDAEHVAATRAVNQAGMVFLERALATLGVGFVPSQANFLLVEVADATRAYQQLLLAGLIVRPMNGYGFPRHLRVSIGLPGENTRLVRALAALVGKEATASALIQPGLGGAPRAGSRS